MNYIRRAESRGQVNLGWLQSKHSFSFGHYFDAQHMGVSVLRVINEDLVKAGQGFGTHGHQDMEIISYVIRGALEHKDSMNNTYLVPAGDIQRMSAGTGVTHSEYNASSEDEVKFLQIWIKPQSTGIKPSYQQKTIEQQGKLTPLVTPDGENGSLSMHQDASIHQLVLAPGESIELSAATARVGYLHIVEGDLTVMEQTQSFAAGDAFTLDDHETLTLQADSPLTALWFDLPVSH